MHIFDIYPTYSDISLIYGQSHLFLLCLNHHSFSYLLLISIMLVYLFHMLHFCGGFTFYDYLIQSFYACG